MRLGRQLSPVVVVEFVALLLQALVLHPLQIMIHHFIFIISKENSELKNFASTSTIYLFLRSSGLQLYINGIYENNENLKKTL